MGAQVDVEFPTEPKDVTDVLNYIRLRAVDYGLQWEALASSK